VHVFGNSPPTSWRHGLAFKPGGPQTCCCISFSFLVDDSSAVRSLQWSSSIIWVLRGSKCRALHCSIIEPSRMRENWVSFCYLCAQHRRRLLEATNGVVDPEPFCLCECFGNQFLLRNTTDHMHLYVLWVSTERRCYRQLVPPHCSVNAYVMIQLAFDSRQGQMIFVLACVSRPAVVRPRPPTQGVPGGPSPSEKQSAPESLHSPQSSADIKKEWSHISSTPYVFMAWCLMT
jgi:hypothetical protein